MNTWRAFYSGVIGGAVFALLLALGRMVGISVNLSILLGTMLGVSIGTGAWLVGFIMHLVVSGLIALLYALGFEYITHRAGSIVGLGFSLVHIILAGLFLGIIPSIHPRIPTQLNAPGIFLSNIGTGGVIEFVLFHLIYGLIVGSLYGQVHHKTRPATHPRHA